MKMIKANNVLPWVVKTMWNGLVIYVSYYAFSALWYVVLN